LLWHNRISNGYSIGWCTRRLHASLQTTELVTSVFLFGHFLLVREHNHKLYNCGRGKTAFLVRKSQFTGSLQERNHSRGMYIAASVPDRAATKRNAIASCKKFRPYLHKTSAHEIFRLCDIVTCNTYVNRRQYNSSC
jgi:hypothetical protein